MLHQRLPAPVLATLRESCWCFLAHEGSAALRPWPWGRKRRSALADCLRQTGQTHSWQRCKVDLPCPRKLVDAPVRQRPQDSQQPGALKRLPSHAAAAAACLGHGSAAAKAAQHQRAPPCWEVWQALQSCEANTVGMGSHQRNEVSLQYGKARSYYRNDREDHATIFFIGNMMHFLFPF